MTTISALLRASPLPLFEARALLAHQLQVSREHLIAHSDKTVSMANVDSFNALQQRRQMGEPLAYLLGQKEFYGRAFMVSPAVLVPRPETELLVELALGIKHAALTQVLELGTGSGCIAITLALEAPSFQVTATDLSLPALEVAQHNARHLGAHVQFIHSDWMQAVTGRFDLIVSNPPYIAAQDAHLTALEHEPRTALVAGSDGLTDLRHIVRQATKHLQPGGWLMVEHGHEQGAAVQQLFTEAGFRQVQTVQDGEQRDRVCRGQL